MKLPSVEIWKVRGLDDILDLTRTTKGKKRANSRISSKLLDRLMRAEHSPIRAVEVIWAWNNIPYYAHVHLVRHHVGIEPYVSTQRALLNRNSRPQGAPVTHACIANLQSIIDISKVRLCRRADPITSYAWAIFLKELHKFVPEILRYTVPTCVYRGWCPEMRTCGAFENYGLWRRIHTGNYYGELHHEALTFLTAEIASIKLRIQRMDTEDNYLTAESESKK